MKIHKEKNMSDTELCEKVIKVIPQNLEEVYKTSEILEDNGISSRYINDEYIENKAYYRYLIEKKYILHLYFENKKLKYLMIYKERPTKQVICEKDL